MVNLALNGIGYIFRGVWMDIKYRKYKVGNKLLTTLQ